jgi:hypothetical protein
MTDQAAPDETELGKLKALLAEKNKELRELRDAMPRHTVRVHQQMALEDAEEDVRTLEAEIARREAADR